MITVQRIRIQKPVQRTPLTRAQEARERDALTLEEVRAAIARARAKGGKR